MIRQGSRRSIAIGALFSVSLLVPGVASATMRPAPAVASGPAVVQVLGLGVDFSTFYPIVDGFEDNLTIEGELLEPATDAITITSVATSKVVRRLYLAMTEGPFNVLWDGRAGLSGPISVAGHGSPVPLGPIVPAGKYTVTQLVTNEADEQLTVVNNIVVSYERLHWYTGSITLNGDQTSTRLNTAAIITPNAPLPGWLQLKVALGPEDGRVAAAGYQFELHSAVSYSSLAFSVLGSGIRRPNFGLQVFPLGDWAPGDPWRLDYFQTGPLPKSYGWSTDRGSLVANLSGRTVRGVVVNTNWAAGYYDIAKVRLTYRYSLLQ